MLHLLSHWFFIFIFFWRKTKSLSFLYLFWCSFFNRWFTPKIVTASQKQIHHQLFWHSDKVFIFCIHFRGNKRNLILMLQLIILYMKNNGLKNRGFLPSTLEFCLAKLVCAMLHSDVLSFSCRYILLLSNPDFRLL